MKSLQTLFRGLQFPVSPKFEQTTLFFNFPENFKVVRFKRPPINVSHLSMFSSLLFSPYLRKDGALSCVPASPVPLDPEDFLCGSVLSTSSFPSRNSYSVIEATIRNNIGMEFLVYKMLLCT